MALFRKKETYNEQMLREAGLDRVVFNTPLTPAPEPEPDSHVYRSGKNHPGPPMWDATTTAIAPAVQGNHIAFTVLPSGDLIVTSEEGDGDLSPFADAIEERLSPPYRAVASRQEGDLWGVGARQIEVATVPFPPADAIELSRCDGVTELRVDGAPSDAAVPLEFERLGGRTGGDCCVQATRIDGDDWEVRVSPL